MRSEVPLILPFPGSLHRPAHSTTISQRRNLRDHPGLCESVTTGLSLSIADRFETQGPGVDQAYLALRGDSTSIK